MRNSNPIGPDPRDIASAPCVLPDCPKAEGYSITGSLM